MPIFTQAISLILNNYADVIEGGNSYRGSGTAWRGIPGTNSNDPDIRAGNDTPLTATSGSTTTFVVASTYSWGDSRWVKTETPPWFALVTTAINSSNAGAARKVSGWNNTTKTFTTAAFPAALSTDTIAMREGFKRAPNTFDIEDKDLGPDAGFDRSFSLFALPGSRLGYYGDGYVTYRTQLELTMRFLKYGRNRDSVMSAFENIMMIRSVIVRGANPDMRDGTYTRALYVDDSTAAEVVVDDKDKIVVKDKYELIYSVDTTYL